MTSCPEPRSARRHPLLAPSFDPALLLSDFCFLPSAFCLSDLSPSFSTASALFCAMEHLQTLCHQPLPHSFPCNEGVPSTYAVSTRHKSTIHCTKSFRMRTYKQTPRFARNWPKLSARNSFRIGTCKNPTCNSFRMRAYEKSRGRGEPHPLLPLLPLPRCRALLLSFLPLMT